MNQTSYLVLGLMALGGASLVYLGQQESGSVSYGSKVVVAREGTYCVPSHCRNLGLLGSTPHPSKYFEQHPEMVSVVSSIKLGDFLDVDALERSFDATFELCANEEVDCLLVAYLPVYFRKLKVLLGDEFVPFMDRYLAAISPQIGELLATVIARHPMAPKVTLLLPTRLELTRAPRQVASVNEYSRYLIKQFPKLKFSAAPLQKITIINTQVEDESQNDAIMDHFMYEYLFEELPIMRAVNLDQKHFHTYHE